MGRVLIAAHRGGAGLWPENSLHAFRSAIALGVDLIELDVHATADGGVAVIHDPTLERTTGGAGPVAGATADDLRRLHLRGADGRLTAEHVPLLDEALAAIAPAPVGVLVEVKGPGRGRRYPGLEERVLAAIDAAGLQGRATLMAFNPEVLDRVHALAPDRPTTLLVSARQVEASGASPEAAVEWARAAGATDLGLEHTLAGPRVLARARAAGLRVGVWTVDEAAAMRRLAALGVDLLTTDRPDVARRVLGGAG